MTTKILALTDALGNLVRFRLVPGNHYDSVDVPPPIKGIAFDGIVARRHSFKPARIAFGAAERRPIAHPPIGMPETCLSILNSATYPAKIRRASTANKELTDGQRHEQAKT